MKPVSPRMASEFAELVYQVRQPNVRGDYRLETRGLSLSRSFDINLSTGPVVGQSGGIFGFFQRASGFAMVADGKHEYEGHHVIAVRGTKTTHDWLTNGNVGLSPSTGGALVHAGFNETFESMKPGLEALLTPRLSRGTVAGIHCIGHSLGGALASLVSDWVHKRYRRDANLYTFGAPRVGMKGFATKSSFEVNKLYRCTHGADPVPAVPLWPFMHAPVNGIEYRLDRSDGLSPSAHGMGEDDIPGYRNTAKKGNWDQLHQNSMEYLNNPVRLDYKRRHEAHFSTYWAERLSSALVTLLKDAGYYSAVLAQAAISTSLTFYDLLAHTLEDIAKASKKFAEQTRGLLGHMLAFARVAVTTVVDLSFQFIRWVFDRTAGALYDAVRQAVERT
ncbi:Lipase (class 3) [Marinobacter segnicrescens]|uniref:Lipase (Class 3) n=1 Tax=Marinobacter segnicrescens TaxID=430453 RepID=A0A1I0E988_9GAMM|nr:lipase family protein [Marinobacter segnicrescens]SET41004.1 Lipase (class 3) [Marinobacter segnicrescens]